MLLLKHIPKFSSKGFEQPYKADYKGNPALSDAEYGIKLNLFYYNFLPNVLTPFTLHLNANTFNLSFDIPLILTNFYTLVKNPIKIRFPYTVRLFPQ